MSRTYRFVKPKGSRKDDNPKKQHYKRHSKHREDFDMKELHIRVYVEN